MTAFDTDILSLILRGDPVYVARLITVAPLDRCVPVVAAAECLRGWLNAIRQAEAGKGRMSMERAYLGFEKSVQELVGFRMLSYSTAGNTQYLAWRTAKVRINSNDLRIAAIASVNGAKLVTRNARDYAQVPGLNLEVWQ